jgi:hypothetical protein
MDVPGEPPPQSLLFPGSNTIPYDTATTAIQDTEPAAGPSSEVCEGVGVTPKPMNDGNQVLGLNPPAELLPVPALRGILAPARAAVTQHVSFAPTGAIDCPALRTRARAHVSSATPLPVSDESIPASALRGIPVSARAAVTRHVSFAPSGTMDCPALRTRARAHRSAATPLPVSDESMPASALRGIPVSAQAAVTRHVSFAPPGTIDCPAPRTHARAHRSATTPLSVSEESTPAAAPRPLSSAYELQIDEMAALAASLFPVAAALPAGGRDRASDLAERAFRRADRNYGLEEALHAVKDTCKDPQIRQRDLADFKACGRQFHKLADTRKEALAHNRLSEARVRAILSPSNPEYQRLIDMGNHGAPVHDLLDPCFTPNGNDRLSWPRQTKGYLGAHRVVDHVLQKNFLSKGLAVVLPADELRHIPGAHVSTLGWTVKADDVLGRPLSDPRMLNTIETKLFSDEHHGQIRHPTIQGMVRMVLDFYDAHRDTVQWEDLILVKMDIKGAYTLLFWESDGAKVFATELTNDEVLIYLCGFFGWTGTPAAFHVITRALQYEMDRQLKGAASIFVDDVSMVTTKEWLEQDMATVHRLIEGLLGKGAVATPKTRVGRKLEFIGYFVDLDTQLLSIGDRCIEKAFYGFMTVDIDKLVPVHDLERLASWGTRYAGICSFIHLFVRALYSSYRGISRHASVSLSPAARRAILIIRVLLMMTVVMAKQFTCTFNSCRLTARGSCIIGEFDASLTGIGVLWFLRDAFGAETLLGTATLDISFLGLAGKPAFQNVCEFIAASCAVRGVQHLYNQGIGGCSGAPLNIVLRGDSISALRWASSQRFRSDRVLNASTIFVLQSNLLPYKVDGSIHLPAEENLRADYLSHLGTEGKTLAGFYSLYPDTQHVPLIDLDAHDLVRLSDPALEFHSEAAFHSWWVEVANTIAFL